VQLARSAWLSDRRHLLNARIVSYEWILIGSVIGAAAGYPLGKWVPMTAMPQRIALSHALGAWPPRSWVSANTTTASPPETSAVAM